MDLNEHFARSHARARHGRRMAWATFAVVLGLVGEVVLLIVAAPQSIGGGPDQSIVILDFVGAVGVTVGLVWMWRIVNADPESDASAWRYRDF